MKKSLEKRLAVRCDIDRAVTFEVTLLEADSPQNAVVTGLGVDVSLGGMGLVTDVPVEAGWVMRLLSPAPDLDLPVLTEVMWATPDHGRFRSGLRFLA